MSRAKRLETLGERFDNPEQVETDPTSSSSRNRERHSIYIDKTLMDEVDSIYKQFRHQAYPMEVPKSLFLERLLERGLQDIESVKDVILTEPL